MTSPCSRGRHLVELLRTAHTRKISKRYSALFINGAKATDTFTYVTPHVDWTERVACEEQLREDMQRRRANFDVEQMKSIWQFYSEVIENKNVLERKKAEIGMQIGQLTKSNGDPHTIEKLKIHANLIKENLKTLKVSLWSIEENAFLRALAVPNALHERTPTEREIIYSHLEKPESGENHVNVGSTRELIIYDTNKNYYLQGDAAIFELGAKFYFSRVLRKHGFAQFSNPDFVKSVVVEGCGTEHTDPSHSFILHHTEESHPNPDSRMHLVGGASLHSFFAYLTKNLLNPSCFPLKYFTMGRKYVPSNSLGSGLFDVNQSSAIESFAAAATPDQMDQMLDEIVEVSKSLYSLLGHHYRLSLAPADRLQQWESLRVSIEMFSASVGEYVEVGNVSASGDYISKRLMLTHSERKQTKFPYIISGTLMTAPRMLACILEQGTEFQLPQQFKVENWAIN